MSDIDKNEANDKSKTSTDALSAQKSVLSCSALPESGPAVGRDWRVAVALSFVGALALFLRLWGIGWSLPDPRHPLATYHPDERINLNAVQRVDIPHLKLDTGFYNYGTFYFYLVSLSHTVGQSYNWIPVAPPTAANTETEYLQLHQRETAGLFLAGRVVTALMGAATVIPLYLLGKRFYGTKVGLFGALFYGIAPLAVVHAHYLTVDVPAAFFATLALQQSSRLLSAIAPQTDSNTTTPKNVWRELLLCGVWTGLATATKYTACIVLIAPITALFLASRSRVGVATATPELELKRSRTSFNLRFTALLCATIVVFLIACPGPWLNPHAFWEGDLPASGLRYELFEHSRTGHGLLFVNTGLGWVYHIAVSFPFGLGLPLTALAFAGAGYACWKRSPADWMLLIFVTVSFALTGLSAVRFARYLIPLYPALCLLGARFALEPFCTGWLRKTAPIFGLFVALYTFAYSFTLVRAFTLPDPRDVAADYLDKNAKQGASIAFAKTPWFFSPPLSPFFGAPDPRKRIAAAAEVTRFQLRIPASEWDVSVLTPPADFVILSSFETQHEVNRLHLSEPVRFVEQVKSQYRPRVFEPSAVLGVNRNDLNLPEDLLYSLPVMTVYEK